MRVLSLPADGVVGEVSYYNLCIAPYTFKVIKRVSKLISVVDLDKYDFFSKWAWPPSACEGGVEIISLCTSTLQYVHDQK